MRKGGRIVRNVVTNVWPISRGQIRFIILTCSNDQVDHPFPGLPLRFSIDRVANPTNAPLCYHPALECPLPSLQVLYTIVAWKLVDTRDKRIALPPLSLSISFNLSAFSSPSSANQHQRESRGTLEIDYDYFNFFKRGKIKVKQDRRVRSLENFWYIGVFL